MVKKRGYQQGLFKPKHPEKYKGDITKIRYMSSYERSFFKFLDNNPSVILWASEEIAIPYRKPTTGRIHKYYPDIWVKYKDRNGKIHQDLVEIKPEAQIRPPTRVGKKKKTQLYEAICWSINSAKWASAQEFCKQYGLNWKLVSEKGIFK